MDDFAEKINSYGDRLCGVMITNPNTSGIFENRFHEIAEAVHEAGGLVYMDGANMNAIAGIIDLGAIGVDAVHNNLHKTWTIPHGGGGPGDAIVAVSERLVDFLPGKQIYKDDCGIFRSRKPKLSIGSFHRHWGNFGHKVRAFAYLLRLGKEGVPRMASTAVLSSRYLFATLGKSLPTLPACEGRSPRMHEFILTLSDEDFARLEEAGIPKAKAIPQVGKFFLDFGFRSAHGCLPGNFRTYDRADRKLWTERTRSFCRCGFGNQGYRRVLSAGNQDSSSFYTDRPSGRGFRQPKPLPAGKTRSPPAPTLQPD